MFPLSVPLCCLGGTAATCVVSQKKLGPEGQVSGQLKKPNDVSVPCSELISSLSSQTGQPLFSQRRISRDAHHHLQEAETKMVLYRLASGG